MSTTSSPILVRKRGDLPVFPPKYSGSQPGVGIPLQMRLVTTYTPLCSGGRRQSWSEQRARRSLIRIGPVHVRRMAPKVPAERTAIPLGGE